MDNSNMLSNSKATTKNSNGTTAKAVSKTVKAVMLSIAGITAGTVFMAAAYYLPVDSFMGFFAAGLFLIPTAFFVYIVQKMAKADTQTAT